MLILKDVAKLKNTLSHMEMKMFGVNLCRRFLFENNN